MFFPKPVEARENHHPAAGLASIIEQLEMAPGVRSDMGVRNATAVGCNH
jgi:hypothetical protein